MRLKSWMISTLFLAFALTLRAAEPQGAAALDAAWVKAMKANDLAGVLACYSPNAVMWVPDESEANGAKAIHDSYADLLSKNTVTDATTSDTHYATVGNMSVGWGHFSLTLAPKAGGAPVVMKGRFSDVVEKKGGRWVYLVDHASAEPAPAAH